MDSDMHADHRVSRRTVVRGAAGAAAVGAATIASAGTAQARTAAAAGPGAAGALTPASERASHGAPEETIIVHLRDARTGRLDLYIGDRHVEVIDRDLAARLVKAAR